MDELNVFEYILEVGIIIVKILLVGRFWIIMLLVVVFCLIFV